MTREIKRESLIGNQNAKKEDPRTSRVWINFTPKEKAMLVRFANKKTLAAVLRPLILNAVAKQK